MSLREINPANLLFQQYRYKVKGYANLIFSLIIYQLLGVLFSLGGIGGSSRGNSELTISIQNYSADMIIGFSILWIIIISATLTGKRYKTMDFTLVTSRWLSHLSNMAFLLTASVFAGVSASLMGVVLRIIVYFTDDRTFIIRQGFHLALTDLLLGMLITALYLMVFSAIAYFIGMVGNRHVIFYLLIPAILFGLARVYPDMFVSLLYLFSKEMSIGVLFIKVLATLLAFFGLSILISNRMEVTR